MNNNPIKLKKSIEKKIIPLVRGIGIDVENVDRFRVRNPKKYSEFYQKIFTDKEITYCMSKSDPYPHFTARFAAKEAVAKAIGSTMYELKDTEISNKATGRPIVTIHSHPSYKVEISLSHTKDQGAAIAIWLR